MLPQTTWSKKNILGLEPRQQNLFAGCSTIWATPTWSQITNFYVYMSCCLQQKNVGERHKLESFSDCSEWWVCHVCILGRRVASLFSSHLYQIARQVWWYSTGRSSAEEGGGGDVMYDTAPHQFKYPPRVGGLGEGWSLFPQLPTATHRSKNSQ